MEARRGPFAAGAGELPPWLAGRDGEQERLAEALGSLAGGRSPGHLVVEAPWGMGKTSLLLWLAGRAMEAGVETAHASGRGLRCDADLHRLLLPPEWLPGWMGGCGQAGWNGELYGLGNIMVERCQERPLLLIVDDAVPEARAELYQDLAHRAMATAREAPLLLVIAGAPRLRRRLSRTPCEDFESSDALPLSALSQPDAERALAAPLETLGIKLDGGLLSRLAARTQGHPLFVQFQGAALWGALRPWERDGQAEVTEEALAEAARTFERRRLAAIKEACRPLFARPALLAAAQALARGLRGQDSISEGMALRLVETAASDGTGNEQRSMGAGYRLLGELERLSFIREGDSWEYGPGMPGMLEYMDAMQGGAGS